MRSGGPNVRPGDALALAEERADYSTLVGPGHVLTCVPNTDHQMYVGAFGRAVIEAHQGGSK